MTSTYRLPTRPPTVENLITAWKSTSPQYYWQPVLDDPDGAGQVYRAIAGALQYLAARTYKAQQARFFIPHSTAGSAPAQFWRYARAEILVRRKQELQDPRTVEAGSMKLLALGGREYENEFVSEWPKGLLEQTITFRCTVPGTVGDLDFVGIDVGGTIKLQTDKGAPDTYYLNHADLSRGRATAGASLIPPLQLSGRTVIRDSGVADQFIATDDTLYVKIVGAANPENVGRTLRVLSFDSPGIEFPLGSELYPHTITVDDGPEATALTAMKVDDGGVFSDYTPEAASDDPDDVLILPASPAVGDAAYFGAAKKFGFLTVTMTTAGVGIWTVAWEYWNGGAWVPFPAENGLVDGTQAFQIVGDCLVTVSSLPADWATVVVDGVEAWYWRARVDMSLGGITQALAGKVQAWVPHLLNTTGEDGTIAWAILDWKDQGFDLVDIPAPTGGVDDSLSILQFERGATPQDGETEESFAARIAALEDTVSPRAIQRAVDRQLAPTSLAGKAWDQQNGMDGLFCDVDALDYYEPGDAYPLNKYKLVWTDNMSYGWFIVLVPNLSNGEWGTSLDEGPSLFIGDKQVWLGPAAESAFLDGKANAGKSSADGIYKSIYDQVDIIRAGYVGFTMFKDDALNTPPC